MSTNATHPCRWCESEAGIAARDVSYGICRKHFNRLVESLGSDDRDNDLAIVGRAPMGELGDVAPLDDRWRYSLAVAAGCAAALAVLVAGVWLVQWAGWWPGR